MKHITLILFLLMISCSTEQVSNQSKTQDSYGTHPRRVSGCAEIKGTAWFDCMEQAQEIWKRRENAEGEMIVLSETRDGIHITRKVRVCWEDFCREFEYEYDNPTLWERIKSYSMVALAGIVVGVAGGVGIANGLVAGLWKAAILLFGL